MFFLNVHKTPGLLYRDSSGRRGCPSIHRSLPRVAFPPGHSIREPEVSGETLLCPDRLGLQQWLTHNSSTQHWGRDSGSITTTTNKPSISAFCQEAVSLFVLCSEWYEHLIAQFSPALETCLPLHVCRRELWDPLVALSHMKRVLIACLV